jgi:tRNA pseudouridine55 synthase
MNKGMDATYNRRLNNDHTDDDSTNISPQGAPAPDSLTGLCGLMLIDKPLRRTSMDVCAAVRAKFRRAGAPKRLKVGHAGTLDPLATGLLVVMVGKATSLCERFMASEKEYVTTIDLSAFTDTDDAEGVREDVSVSEYPSALRIRATLDDMTGTLMQRPPAYSAMKVNGQRAYDLARRGQAPVLAPRPVQIYSITIESYEWPLLILTIRCGKGTYIRSIARDLGERLGTGGTLTSLRRTASGNFEVKNARGLSDLPDILSPADLLPLDAYVS